MPLAELGHGITLSSRRADDLVALHGELMSAGTTQVNYGAADMGGLRRLTELVESHRAKFGSMNVPRTERWGRIRRQRVVVPHGPVRQDGRGST
jgi:hypothetical protein